MPFLTPYHITQECTSTASDPTQYLQVTHYEMQILFLVSEMNASRLSKLSFRR